MSRLHLLQHHGDVMLMTMTVMVRESDDADEELVMMLMVPAGMRGATEILLCRLEESQTW